MLYSAGLVLEGGGMRGVYTAGVLDCLLDEGISFEAVYGVSAGACHACSYLSGQRGRAARTVIDFVGDRRYASFHSLFTTGDFFGVQMVYHDIPEQLIPYDFAAYRRQPARFYAVVTNMRTGGAEYLPVLDMKDDIDIIRASSSLPLLSRAVYIAGEHYLDGGIADSIPLDRSIADGNRHNLVVLTRHRGYQKKLDSMLPAMQLKYRKYPAFVAAMERRHRQYNAALDRVYAEQQAENTFVIQPNAPVGIGRLEKDREKLRALYQEGYDDAAEQIGALRAFLARTQTPGKPTNQEGQ